MSDDPKEGDDRSASDLADIDRASRAGEDDGKDGTYDPDDKLSSDTEDQKEAYDQSYGEADKE